MLLTQGDAAGVKAAASSKLDACAFQHRCLSVDAHGAAVWGDNVCAMCI